MFGLSAAGMENQGTPPEENGQAIPAGAPANYREILGIVALAAGEPLDPGNLEAKQKLREMGDDAVPALKMMFAQVPSDGFQAQVVSAMLTSKVNRKDAINFLLPQIPADLKEWNGKAHWIGACILGICRSDAERGLPLARKGIGASNEHLSGVALRSLGESGGEDDLRLIREEMARRDSAGTDVRFKGSAMTALEAISQRLESQKK